MISVDVRISQEMVKNMVGKTFKKYRCDPFAFTNTVTQIIGLYIGDDVYKITNIQEPVDYFGTPDDIAVFRCNYADNTEIKSAFVETEQMDTPVDTVIDEVRIINEHQEVYENGVKTYDVWLTRGIIFVTAGREISFEKENIPFSEEIEIRRGYDLINNYSDVNEFTKDWDDGITARAVREIVTIK